MKDRSIKDRKTKEYNQRYYFDRRVKGFRYYKKNLPNLIKKNSNVGISFT